MFLAREAYHENKNHEIELKQHDVNIHHHRAIKRETYCIITSRNDKIVWLGLSVCC